ncbi:hypothetical protein T484DRAFT_1963518 [Baffinella frigidus]|nr:hypothetical protein T484DRAFT_1963518 [Cryptophyta sp. CCMP2293]
MSAASRGGTWRHEGRHEGFVLRHPPHDARNILRRLLGDIVGPGGDYAQLGEVRGGRRWAA